MSSTIVSNDLSSNGYYHTFPTFNIWTLNHAFIIIMQKVVFLYKNIVTLFAKSAIGWQIEWLLFKAHNQTLKPQRLLALLSTLKHFIFFFEI